MEEVKDQIIGEVNKQVFQEYRNLVDSKDKEIERLNNIIEELEKYINKRIEYCYNNGTYEDVFDVYNEIAMKLLELQELKRWC